MSRSHAKQSITLMMCVTSLLATPLLAQSSATLQGRVFDASDAIAAETGTVTATATAPGFASELIEELTIDVGRTLARDFRLAIGDRTLAINCRNATVVCARRVAS